MSSVLPSFHQVGKTPSEGRSAARQCSAACGVAMTGRQEWQPPPRRALSVQNLWEGVCVVCGKVGSLQSWLCAGKSAVQERRERSAAFSWTETQVCVQRYVSKEYLQVAERTIDETLPSMVITEHAACGEGM